MQVLQQDSSSEYRLRILHERFSSRAKAHVPKPIQLAMRLTPGNVLVSAPHHAGKTFGWLAKAFTQLALATHDYDSAVVLIIYNTHQAAQYTARILHQFLDDDYHVALVHDIAPSNFARGENDNMRNSLDGAKVIVGTMGRLLH